MASSSKMNSKNNPPASAEITRLTIIFSLLFATPAGAHGGGLDSDGCHNNLKKVDYHCYRESHTSDTEAHDKPPHQTPYSRDLYSYISYPTNISTGFYTGMKCQTNIDHVVSLKDAHESGGFNWPSSKRVRFANDKSNHVPSCKRINSSKGSSAPKDFFKKSSDRRGMDYMIKNRCAYVEIYFNVKKKYNLTFTYNEPEVFAKCGIALK